MHTYPPCAAGPFFISATLEFHALRVCLGMESLPGHDISVGLDYIEDSLLHCSGREQVAILLVIAEGFWSAPFVGVKQVNHQSPEISRADYGLSFQVNAYDVSWVLSTHPTSG